jgi:hypothetical protein
VTKNTAPSSASPVPIATMVWNEIRTMLTGGRSASGTESSPTTRASGSWWASSESSFGTSIP